MRTALLSSLALLLACGSNDAPAPPPSPPSSVAPEPAPVPAAPTRAHAIPLGPPTIVGEHLALDLFAPALARLAEPCFDGATLPTEVTVSATVLSDGALSDIALGPPDDAEVACLRAALADVRLLRRDDPAPASIRVRLDVVSAFEDRFDFAFPGDARQLCREDRDCVLVTGGCTGPEATNVDYAEGVDADRQALLSVSDCARPAAGAAAHPMCEGLLCRAVPDEHQEWRTCTSSGQCVALLRECTRWTGVARAHEAEARAAFGDVRETCDTPPDDEPHLACRYGACVADWYGD